MFIEFEMSFKLILQSAEAIFCHQNLTYNNWYDPSQLLLVWKYTVLKVPYGRGATTTGASASEEGDSETVFWSFGIFLWVCIIYKFQEESGGEMNRE